MTRRMRRLARTGTVTVTCHLQGYDRLPHYSATLTRPGQVWEGKASTARRALRHLERQVA